MLSSGESSAVVSKPAIVKAEPDRETQMPSLLEPGLLFNEAYSDGLVAVVKRMVFSQPVAETDACRWKSLGYWLCSVLASLQKPSDIFSQTCALRMITDVSGAFFENLLGIRQWYSILLHVPEVTNFAVFVIL